MGANSFLKELTRFGLEANMTLEELLPQKMYLSVPIRAITECVLHDFTAAEE